MRNPSRRKQAVMGGRRIGPLPNGSARRPVPHRHLENGYRAMAADADREREAEAWCEGLVGDVANDAR